MRGEASASIRPGAPAELPALAFILRAARQDAVPGLPLPGLEEVVGWQRDLFTSGAGQTAEAPSVDFMVAEADGAIAGFIAADRPALGEVGMIHHIHVDPAVQRRGIGTALLGCVMGPCPDPFEDAWDAWVFERNANGRRFWDRHGYVLVSGPTRRNQQGEPAVCYAWPGPLRELSPDEFGELLGQRLTDPMDQRGNP